MLTNLDFAKKLLLNWKTHERNSKISEWLPLVGKGLLTSEGAEHRWQRKLLNKAFLPGQLKKYFPKFVEYSNLLAKVLIDC